MSDRPLAHPRLCAIRDRLDAGDLAGAQQLLAELDELLSAHPGADYLATRVLFERGTIDATGVAERLATLIERHGSFLEAAEMLDAALTGTLKRNGGGLAGTGAADDMSPPPTVEVPPQMHDGHSRNTGSISTSPPTVPLIPPAPPVPRFAPTADRTPSYVPASAPTTLRDERSRSSHRPLPREEPDAVPTLPLAPEVVRLPSRLSSSPPRIRSGKRAVIENDAATPLLSIITLLDEELYAEALTLLDRIDRDAGPELLLLRARALLGARRIAEAREVVRRLAAAPLLEPQLRAASARLLIELGEPEDALEQARRVYADDASSALVRQTLAWALMRCAWRGNRHAAMQAKSLIADLEMQSNPRRALLLALRAGAEALVGQAALALESASQALTLDPQNLDAQIACAVASARIGDEGAAKTAYLALSALDEKTRLAIALVLEQLGVDPIREPAERAARTT